MTANIVSATRYATVTTASILGGQMLWFLWIIYVRKNSASVSPDINDSDVESVSNIRLAVPEWLKGFNVDADAYKVVVAEIFDPTLLPANVRSSMDQLKNRYKGKSKCCMSLLDGYQHFLYYTGYIARPVTIIILQCIVLAFICLHFWLNYEPKYVGNNFVDVNTDQYMIMASRFFAMSLFLKISSQESKRNQDLIKFIMLRVKNKTLMCLSCIIPVIGEIVCYLVVVTTCIMVVHSDNMLEIILDCLAISFVIDLDNSLLHRDTIQTYEEKKEWYVIPKNKKYEGKHLCCFMAYDMLQAISQIVITLVILPCASFKLSDERMRKLWFGTNIVAADEETFFNITNNTQNMCTVKCYTM